MDEIAVVTPNCILVAPVVDEAHRLVRGGWRASLGGIAFLLLLSILATAGGWRAHHVLAPAVEQWPARGARSLPPLDPELARQATLNVPHVEYAASRWRESSATRAIDFEGHILQKRAPVPIAARVPLWNPYAGLGQPFLADPDCAVFYPTIFLHAWMKSTWAWTLAAALKFFVAGLGAWMLARRYGVGSAGRVMAGMAYMLCGFGVVFINDTPTNVTALLPWAMLCLQRLIDRPTALRILVAALVLMLQFIGGAPVESLQLVLACALLWIAQLLCNSPRAALRAAPACVIALAVGLGLAGAQWLPMFAYLSHGATRVAGLAPASPNAWPLLGMLFPWFGGAPADHLAPAAALFHAHWAPASRLAIAWIGALPLLLAIYAIAWGWRRRDVLMWTALGAVTLLIALAFNGVPLLAQRLPALGLGRTEHLLVVTALVLAILAGIGLEALLAAQRAGDLLPRLRKRIARLAIALAALSIVTTLAALAARSTWLRHAIANTPSSTADAARASFASSFRELIWTCLRLLIPAAAVGAAWFILWRASRQAARIAAAADAAAAVAAAASANDEWGSYATENGPTSEAPSVSNVDPAARAPIPLAPVRPLRFFAWPWLAIAAVELLIFAIPCNWGGDLATYRGDSPIASLLYRQQSAGDLPQRLIAARGILPPRTATLHQLHDVRAVGDVVPRRYADFLRAAGALDAGAAAPGATDPTAELTAFASPAMELASVRYALLPSPAPATQPWRALDAGGAAESAPVSVFENPQALPRLWLASSAQAYPTDAQVLQKLGGLNLNRRRVVLLDKQLPPDLDEWFHQPPNPFAPPDRQPNADRAFDETAQPSRSATMEVIEDRPERIVIRMREVSGWLVMADGWSRGWEAKFEGGPLGKREVDLLPFPAFGAMRSTFISGGETRGRGFRGGRFGRGGGGGDGSEAVCLVWEYHPISYRRGLLVSSLAGIGALLLLAWAAGRRMMRRRR